MFNRHVLKSLLSDRAAGLLINTGKGICVLACFCLIFCHLLFFTGIIGLYTPLTGDWYYFKAWEKRENADYLAFCARFIWKQCYEFEPDNQTLTPIGYAKFDYDFIFSGQTIIGSMGRSEPRDETRIVELFPNKTVTITDSLPSADREYLAFALTNKNGLYVIDSNDQIIYHPSKADLVREAPLNSTFKVKTLERLSLIVMFSMVLLNMRIFRSKIILIVVLVGILIASYVLANVVHITIYATHVSNRIHN